MLRNWYQNRDRFKINNESIVLKLIALSRITATTKNRASTPFVSSNIVRNVDLSNVPLRVNWIIFRICHRKNVDLRILFTAGKQFLLITYLHTRTCAFFFQSEISSTYTSTVFQMLLWAVSQPQIRKRVSPFDRWPQNEVRPFLSFFSFLF